MKKNLFLKICKISRFFSIGFSILFLLVFYVWVNAANLDFNSSQKIVELIDDGMVFELVSKSQTVEDFLNEQKIALGEKDIILPEKNNKIFSGAHIIISRAKKITIKEGGKTFQTYTLQNTVEQVIWENKNIQFSDDDIANPSRKTLVKNGMIIAVTHVVIKEEIKKQDIDFKTIAEENDSLGWRVKKITQKGIKGKREIKYRVVYYDEKEISRKVLENNIVKDPINEIATQGTYVKLGKAARGDGTWYAWKGGLFAASRTIPRGSYAKVTNMDNGNSVIVQINDYGPQAPERIVDLDKVAFAKLADVGVGVLHNVKVEQILN